MDKKAKSPIPDKQTSHDKEIQRTLDQFGAKLQRQSEPTFVKGTIDPPEKK